VVFATECSQKQGADLEESKRKKVERDDDQEEAVWDGEDSDDEPVKKPA
jgi:hypothetical protein